MSRAVRNEVGSCHSIARRTAAGQWTRGISRWRVWARGSTRWVRAKRGAVARDALTSSPSDAGYRSWRDVATSFLRKKRTNHPACAPANPADHAASLFPRKIFLKTLA